MWLRRHPDCRRDRGQRRRPYQVLVVRAHRAQLLVARVDLDLELIDRHDTRFKLQTLMTAPGTGWVLGYTIAAEIGDIERFASADKLVGYTGLCPRVIQSGDSDRRGPLTKSGPKFLRWAMLEATMHDLRHEAYAERYQRTKRRLGKQRGAKVAQIDIARRLTKSLWHMLTYNQPFSPQTAAGGAALRLAA